ncbi:MAG TPA: cation:proton antiporter [Chitinophagaceae bacterium]|nr:cation:proton antiporter [Chitinophagaceae bacterium]
MVSKLSSAEVLNFLIIVSIILISSRLLGEVFRKFKQPVVVGEILAGIIIGPSLLGSAFPDLFKQVFMSQPRAYGAFDGLANIGVIMLMFIAGSEVDLKQIRKQGRQAASISLFGLLFPFALGFFCIWFFHDYIFSVPATDRLIPSLFFGTALSITALSVIVKVLMDLNIIRTKIGGLVLTAAMIDDFLGWILFSVIIQMMNAKSDASFGSIMLVLLFVGFMMTIGRWMVDKILAFSVKYLAAPSGIITVAICLCMLGAVLTEYLGIRGIFGAFLMGVAVGDSKYFNHHIQNVIQQFVVNILAPLFFASVGLRVNFVTNFDLSVVLIILGISCIAKIVGAGIGSRISGLNKNESLSIAFGMNARGSQEIVLGMLALQAKIIDERIFVGLVVMTMVTILIAGPLMKYYLEKDLKVRNEEEQEAKVLLLQNEAGAYMVNK